MEEASWFRQWRSYEEFTRRISEVDEKIPSSILFNHNKAKWLREGLTLAEFGGLARTRIERMRLNQFDPPDAYIFKQGRAVPIEITEILEPGRKRGEEYKSGGQPSDGNASDWRRRSESIGKALCNGIEKKLQSRNESPDTMLLVYLNISDWGIRHTETETEIRLVLRRTHNVKPVKVLWKGKLYECNGR